MRPIAFAFLDGNTGKSLATILNAIILKSQEYRICKAAVLISHISSTFSFVIYHRLKTVLSCDHWSSFTALLAINVMKAKLLLRYIEERMEMAFFQDSVWKNMNFLFTQTLKHIPVL